MRHLFLLSVAFGVLLLAFPYFRSARDIAYRSLGLMNEFGQNTRTIFRTEIKCPRQTDRTMVAVVFGQSNAANSGQGRSKGNARVVNVFDGRCFETEDPILGAGGTNGSVWVPMANELIESNRHDLVVLIPIAIGNSSVNRWNGDLAALLSDAVRSSPYRVTHFLWHQGEADNQRLGAAEYSSALKGVVAQAQREAPGAGFWVSIASRCGPNFPADAEIQRGQLSVIDKRNRVFAGPNTDALGDESRHDGCHFSEAGRREVGSMWASAVSSGTVKK